MLSLDFNQARRYIELLTGDLSQSIHWQLFSDDKSLKDAPSSYCNIGNTESFLQQQQQLGYGVYVTINQTDGKGRKYENVTKIRVCFADLDGIPLPSAFPLQPKFITARDSHHSHIYWPVEGVLTHDQYSALQMRIALYLGSDPQVIDATRLARVPGTYNLKDRNNPAMYVITHDHSDTVVGSYTPEQIVSAFPLGTEGESYLAEWSDNRKAKSGGQGFTDAPNEIARCEHYYAVIAKPSMEEGTQRSLNILRNAGFAVDRGVSLHITQEMMWRLFNPRCCPPWNDQSQFYEYVARGYKYAGNTPGCLTAVGVFSNADPIAEPVGGFEAAAETAKASTPDAPVAYSAPVEGHDEAYVTKAQADELATLTNSKSNPHKLSRLFLGANYPERNLIRYDGNFYAYNDYHWEYAKDDRLINEIENQFHQMELAPSKIKNIFDKVKNLSYRKKEPLKGSWLNGDPEENCIIMKNGILRIVNSRPELLPHDKLFFDLNMVDFEYDPEAWCEEFIRVIEAQWNGDPEMLRQVQELYGWLLMNDTRHQLLPILIGKSRSGKGMHTTIIRHLIGAKHICSPSLDGLSNDAQIVEMTKAKLAIIPEANSVSNVRKDLVLDRLKLITGNDSLTVDQKYKESLTWSRWPNLLMTANQLPDFIDASGAFANRVWPFHFPRSYAGKEDKGLISRLTTPEALAGIFNWALEGAVRVMQNDGVYFSQTARELIDDIRYDSFPLSKFVTECCNLNPDYTTTADELYDAYLVHARSSGVKMPLSPQKFSKMLTASALSVTRKRLRQDNSRHRKYHFIGIGIDDLAMKKMVPGSFTPIDGVINDRSKESNN